MKKTITAYPALIILIVTLALPGDLTADKITK